MQNAFVFNLLQLGDYERALDQLRFLEAGGASPSIVANNRAVVHILQGELELAAGLLQEVLEQDPDNHEAREKLQLVRSKMGQQLAARAEAVASDRASANVIGYIMGK